MLPDPGPSASRGCPKPCLKPRCSIDPTKAEVRPRSFSPEKSLLGPAHDAPRILNLEPWRVAHSPVNFSARAHDPTRPVRPQDTLESYYARSAGSSKMPLRGDLKKTQSGMLVQIVLNSIIEHSVSTQQ